VAINIIEDIKSVTELKTRTREVLERLHRTGRPVIITVSGKPDAVLVEAAEFERLQQALNLARLLADGEADVRAGRSRPADDFLRELDDEIKVPRRNHRKRRG
jgi:prevent-host-death family protein